MSREITQFDPEKMRDVSIPMTRIATTGLWLALVLFVVPLIPHGLLWGFSLSFDIELNSMILLIVGMILLVIVHEATHAIGWIVFAGAPREAVSFGIDRKTLSPYAHLSAPVKANDYRIAVALPLIVTGILPTLIGTAINNPLLTFLGAFLVSGAVGDLFVLWAIRSVPGDARVLDHPSNAGCYVLLE